MLLSLFRGFTIQEVPGAYLTHAPEQAQGQHKGQHQEHHDAAAAMGNQPCGRLQGLRQLACGSGTDIGQQREVAHHCAKQQQYERNLSERLAGAG
jgi:hypothetical protein